MGRGDGEGLCGGGDYTAVRDTFFTRAIRAASVVLAACTAFSPAAVGIARSQPVQAWVQSLPVGSQRQARSLMGLSAAAELPLDLPPVPLDPGLTLEQLRQTTFPDLPENAADADAIRFAAHQRLIQGYGDGTFRPDGLLTRGQAVTILRRTARLLGLDSGEAFLSAARQNGASLDNWVMAQTGETPDLHTVSVNGVDLLLDDGAEARFLSAGNGGSETAASLLETAALSAAEDKTDAQWALEAGILPSPDGLERQADRACLAEYLYRFARWAGADVSCSGNLGAWPDGGSVPEASKSALSWGMESGVFRTIVENALTPGMSVSRGQAARLITALIARIPEKTFANGGIGTDDDTETDGGGAEYAPVPDMSDRPLADDALAEQSGYGGGPPVGGAANHAEASWYDPSRSPETALAAEIAARTDRGAFASASQAKHAELQAAIDAIAQRYHAVGLQAAVIENGRLTDVFASGWAVKNGVPLTADHKMRVASLSKVLVGLAAAELREQGVVDFDVPIGTYWNTVIRNPSHPNTPVNIKSLLTHTSSLYVTETASLAADAVRSRLVSGQGFGRGVPGSLSWWNYNNYGFGVLGLTLEKAAGKTLDDVLNGAFFDAMGIDASFYGGDVARRDLVVPIYQGGSVERTAERQLNAHAGAPGSNGSYFAGGFTVSARDLGKVAALLANDGVYEGVRFLSEASVELMESHQQVWLEGGFCQAMPLRYRGWAYGRERVYYHTG
ncbi:MAG: serine hydrolase, partial [Oscillibacter sp.]|nr:serine hydrolase [Oscillibacter sp.]